MLLKLYVEKSIMTILAGFKSFSRDYLEQFFLSAILSLAFMTTGLAMGWITPVLLSLPQENPNIYIDADHGSWLAAAPSFGNIIGCVLGGYLLNKIGRKRTILLSSPLNICGFLLSAFANNFEIMVTGRILVGVGCGIAMPAVPVYIAECTRPEIRGRFCSFPASFGAIGGFLGTVIGSYLPWDHALFVMIALPVAYFIFLLPFPDSPPWLYSRGKVEEAEAAIIWLNKTQKLDAIRDQYKKDKDNRDITNDKSICTYFKKPVMYPFIIVTIMLIFQILTGVGTFLSYSSQIFQAANTTLDSNVQTIIMGAIRIPGTVISFFAVDKYGRKPLLYISGFLIGIALAIFGMYYYLEPSGQMDNFRWLPLFCLCAFMIAYHLGYSSIPFLLVGEILPENGRSALSGVATCILNLLTAVLIKTYPDINHQFGIFSQFWMFSACSFISCLFVWKFVPETKNRTLQEIEDHFGKVNPTKS